MFLYDHDGQLIDKYRDNASTATSPIQIYYVHADHLNTPRVIVNTANTIVWRWENTHAFGANLPDEDPDGNAQLFEYHPRFPGQ